MFNLEQAIAEWRRQMRTAGIKSPAPLEELESHLREEVELQLRSGVNARQAFATAAERIGKAGKLKSEFAKLDGMKQVLQQKVVWALTSVAFLSCWIEFRNFPGIALAYGILLAGLVVATFVDFKHFVIPDPVSLGGVLVGLLCSLCLPSLHGQTLLIPGMLQSLLGIGVGAGAVYFVLRAGKLAFGRQRFALTGETKIIFTDTALLLPEKEISYDEIFYRKSDAITLRARTVELNGRSYRDVPIRVTPTSVQIGDETFNPQSVSSIEAISEEIILPREAMGLGDVKLMAAIGAFLGWQAVIFTLMASSVIGSLVGCGLIAARRREWSSKLPYGPYIAFATTIWIFGGKNFFEAIFAP